MLCFRSYEAIVYNMLLYTCDLGLYLVNNEAFRNLSIKVIICYSNTLNFKHDNVSISLQIIWELCNLKSMCISQISDYDVDMYICVDLCTNVRNCNDNCVK